jgi:hypothetical protein
VNTLEKISEELKRMTDGLQSDLAAYRRHCQRILPGVGSSLARKGGGVEPGVEPVVAKAEAENPVQPRTRERASYDGDTAIKLYPREIGKARLLPPRLKIKDQAAGGNTPRSIP